MNSMRNIVFIVVLLCWTGSAGAAAFELGKEVERIDPISGLRWRRITDAARPAAPPRLKLLPSRGIVAAEQDIQPVPCVRAGDRVVLQSAPGSYSLSLAATVLQTSSRGDHVRARVAVTGAIVQITVLCRGEGLLIGNGSAWR
jgi:hypothetical protein